jgi:hypothetical protein
MFLNLLFKFFLHLGLYLLSRVFRCLLVSPEGHWENTNGRPKSTMALDNVVDDVIAATGGRKRIATEKWGIDSGIIVR